MDNLEEKIKNREKNHKIKIEIKELRLNRKESMKKKNEDGSGYIYDGTAVFGGRDLRFDIKKRLREAYYSSSPALFFSHLSHYLRQNLEGRTEYKFRLETNQNIFVEDDGMVSYLCFCKPGGYTHLMGFPIGEDKIKLTKHAGNGFKTVEIERDLCNFFKECYKIEEEKNGNNK